MIQKAFGDDAVSAAQVQVRHKCFKDGQEAIKNYLSSGKPAKGEHLRMLNMYGLQSKKI